MDIECLRDRSIEFLRRYGHLDDPDRGPDFTDDPLPGKPLTAAGIHLHYRDDPLHYQSPMSGEEVYTNRFRKTQSGFKSIYFLEFRTLLNDIPDSEEYIVIDIGSSLARRTTRPIARKKPNVEFVLVDKIGRDKIESEDEYEWYENQGENEELRVRVPFRISEEETINELLRANGYHNLTYYHKELILLPEGISNFEGELRNRLQRKRVIVSGYKSPVGLGNITLNEALFYRAERILLENNAMEKIPPNSKHFNRMREFLDGHLSGQEIEKVISLIHDPYYKTREYPNSKYRYEVPGQKMYAAVLKQLFNLTQLDILANNGYVSELYAFEFRGPGNYNQSDQAFQAYRT